MQKESAIRNKLKALKDAAWTLPVKNHRSYLFARKYAIKTKDLIQEGVSIVGDEAGETDLFTRVEDALDMGRFSIFTTLVILPGGVVSLLGLELLARKFGIKGFNLFPSSFRKRQKSKLPAKPFQKKSDGHHPSDF